MKDIELANSALGEAAEAFLSQDSFSRADAPLITLAEQMLQMQEAWQIQLNAVKQKAQAAQAAAMQMPEYETDDA